MCDGLHARDALALRRGLAVIPVVGLLGDVLPVRYSFADLLLLVVYCLQRIIIIISNIFIYKINKFKLRLGAKISSCVRLGHRLVMSRILCPITR